MIFLMGILGALALGGMVFLFISPKSSKLQKKAALFALIVSGAALVICAIIVFIGLAGGNDDPYAFPPDAAEVRHSGINILEILIFLFVLIAVFGFIVYMGLRERKKQEAKKHHQSDSDTEFSSKDF